MNIYVIDNNFFKLIFLSTKPTIILLFTTEYYKIVFTHYSCDIRSILSRVLRTGILFSFSETGCYTKVFMPRLPYFLAIA